MHFNELEYYLLGPDELGVDFRYIALHAKSERQQGLFCTYSQKGTSDFWVVSAERCDEHERMLVMHEKRCQELCQATEQMSERQELLATVMEKEEGLAKRSTCRILQATLSGNQGFGGASVQRGIGSVRQGRKLVSRSMPKMEEEREREKLAVEGEFTSTASRSRSF